MVTHMEQCLLQGPLSSFKVRDPYGEEEEGKPQRLVVAVLAERAKLVGSTLRPEINPYHYPLQCKQMPAAGKERLKFRVSKGVYLAPVIRINELL